MLSMPFVWLTSYFACLYSSIGWPATQYAHFLHVIAELPSQPCMCLLLILIIILQCFLFSSFIRKSATSFFAAYDALCEEGTATPVCNDLDEIADIAVPGSKDHVEVQGEILEGLVPRIVPRQSSVQMEEVFKNFHQAPLDGAISSLRTEFLTDILKSRANECFDSFHEGLRDMFKDLSRL